MLIDTHMHIGYDFGVEPDLYVKNAKENGVEYLISSFCEKKDLEISTEFVDKYDNLFACIGYHPEIANDIVDNDFLILKEKLLSNKKYVAIGEIGLDYYWNKDNKEKQKYVFEKQLELASELNLPVVIHSREATGDIYDILSKYKVRGVIHCFSGSLEMAKRFIDLGFYIGIGGVLTFKNSNLYKVVENIDLDKICLETDSPYLTPEPNRGKTNESSNVVYVAKKVAEIKNISYEEVCRVTSNNAISLFDLNI